MVTWVPAQAVAPVAVAVAVRVLEVAVQESASVTVAEQGLESARELVLVREPALEVTAVQ